MANLYYREDLAAEDFFSGALIEITGEEARHAVRVSRLRTGERILVGNARGTIGAGVVEHAGRDAFSVRLDEVRTAPAAWPRLVLAQALAKGDRDERAVEQATEFGVDAIVPWEAARSVSRWRGGGSSGGGGAGGAGEKATRGAAKWRRIAREASKQSLRAWSPEVCELASLADLCALSRETSVDMVVLHPVGARSLSSWAADRARGGSWEREVFLVVGPEGGFSDAELADLDVAGAQQLTLGSTVLRTSSAGPAALAVLNAALGRW